MEFNCTTTVANVAADLSAPAATASAKPDAALRDAVLAVVAAADLDPKLPVEVHAAKLASGVVVRVANVTKEG